MGDAEVTLAIGTDQVLRLTPGLRASTLDYWINKGLVGPSVRPSSGHRRTRLWSVRDVVLVRTIKALRDNGCPLQRIAAAKETIEESWGETLASTVLVWNGDDLFSIGEWGEVRSVWRRPGQIALFALALPLGQWRTEAEATSAEVKTVPGARAV